VGILANISLYTLGSYLFVIANVLVRVKVLFIFFLSIFLVQLFDPSGEVCSVLKLVWEQSAFKERRSRVLKTAPKARFSSSAPKIIGD